MGAILASERRTDLADEELRLVCDALIAAEREGSHVGHAGTVNTIEAALLNVRREIRSREGRGASAPLPSCRPSTGDPPP